VERLREIVEKEGLLLLGVVPLDVTEDFARYESWIDEGRHGGLEFLERHRELRRDPAQLLEGARSAVLVALPYDQADTWEETPASPRVAQYARFRDYHKVLWESGARIAEAIEREISPGSLCRVVSDSAPVLERALAARSTAGFIGKNTCYIDPKRGSFLLLGEILTTAELPLATRSPQDPTVRNAEGGCGTCDLCQVHCPTGALSKDYSIDTDKCLAYWTIEHRGPVPEIYWPHFKTYWYGCDLCQLACPYNRKARGWALPERLKPREIPPLEKVALMTQTEYERWFGGTAMTRARREGLRRNALIALHVTGHPELARVLTALETESEPTLRQTAEQIRRRGARSEGHPPEAPG
jgi:epoxyqueuosine reductase